MELADGLVEILDVLGHGRGRDGLPRFFDDQCLAPFLDAHLLQEHVHDDQHNDGEKHGVILYLVDFKDDEPLVKEVHVHVGVQRGLQLSAPVELFQDGGEIMDIEADLVHGHNLGDTLQRELVIGVEGQLPDFQPAPLLLDMPYLPVRLHQLCVLVEFLLVLLYDGKGAFPLSFAGGPVPCQRKQGTALS